MTDLMNIQQPELMTYDEADDWRRAYALWLAGKSAATRRAYGRIVGDFFQFANVPPAQVTGDMVNAWKLHLQSLQRRDTTVAQRLAGLSSFFRYLMKRGLLARNPVDQCERGDLDDSPYGNARPMTKADFNAILQEFDTTSATGALYRAVFTTYALTGRRRSELLRLRGRDLTIDGDRVHYRVTVKGGKTVHRLMPAGAWRAIVHYRSVAGLPMPPAEDEALFVATHNTGSYIDSRGNHVGRAVGEHISGTAVAEALKRAAERAGVDPQRVTVHGMRHLSARLWKDAHGKDLRGLQEFLGHANIQTTVIYDSNMFGGDDTDFDAMADALFGSATMAQ